MAEMADLFSAHRSNPDFVSWWKRLTCSTIFLLSSQGLIKDTAWGFKEWIKNTRMTGLSSVDNKGEERKANGEDDECQNWV